MSLATGPQSAANPKLPLGATISLSYSSYFRNFADVLRASWLWLVLAAPLSGIVGWLQGSWYAEAVASMKQGFPSQIPSKPLQMTVLGSLDNLLLVIAGISIAVAWHRRIILGERPGFSGSNVIAESFWRYVWVGILTGLIVGIPALSIVVTTLYFGFRSTTGGASAQAFWWFTTLMMPALFVICLAAAAVFLRLSLLFPARAAGDVELSLKQTWHRTSGNAWRMIWGVVVCAVLPLLAAQIIVLLLVIRSPVMLADHAFAVQSAAIGAISMIYHLLILPIGIGFLSHAYRHFFRPA